MGGWRDDFHKPAMFGGSEFEAFAGGDDPAAVIRAAHETARALLARARESDDPAVIDRLVSYTDEHGIDVLAELWARATPHSLPGALWRLYLVRAHDPPGSGGRRAALPARHRGARHDRPGRRRGAESGRAAGGRSNVADRILRGVFEGDLGIALERAAAFCRVEAAGATSIADDQDAASPERASELTTRAARLATTAEELTACARLARSDSLD